MEQTQQELLEYDKHNTCEKYQLWISTKYYPKTLSQVNKTQSPNNCLSEVSYIMQETLNTKHRTGTIKNKPYIEPYIKLPKY